MKIIHCSDIHLGASMRTHLTPDRAKKRQEELLSTFSRMVDYAITNDVEGIIIAGDLLDTDECDLKTRNFLINTIKNASKIQFYYLCGNHDENSVLIRGDELPANLNIFGNKWTTFKLGGVNITGVTLGDDNRATYDSLSLPAMDFNIVVLHGGDVHGTATDEPDTVNLDLLKNKKIDYLALGHLHTYRAGKLDSRAEYCYSGCLEGRGFDECGEKGFVLLDISPSNHLETQFIPFARRTLHEVYVNITGLMNTHDIIKEIEENIEDISADSLVRVVLTGEFTIKTEKHTTLMLAKLEPKFFYVTIKDKSRLKLDIDKYANDVSIAGEFVRQVRASDLDEEEQRRVIALGLHALAGEEVEL